MIHPLYPYDSIELAVIFVYGNDFPRRMNILIFPEALQMIFGSVGIYIDLTTFVLYIIRKQLKYRRKCLVSSFMDTVIPFIVGGNVEIRQKYEKLFFIILLISAFLMTSVFSGDLLDCFIRILNQKVSTFEQLAKVNSSINSFEGFRQKLSSISSSNGKIS